MADLIERLQDQSWRDGRTLSMAELEVWDKTCREAVGEIERLRDENRSLALQLTGAHARAHALWSKYEAPPIVVTGRPAAAAKGATDG